MRPLRTTRTCLAVPAHRPKLVRSAARSVADAVFLDLEDAVPVSEKSEALQGAAQALRSLDWGSKTVSVRINEPGSSLARQEVSVLCALS